MAGFILYFPGARDATNPRQLFADHGCAELLDADDELPQVGSNPVVEGPDGGAGLIARWSGPYDPPLGYSAARQQWQPASQCGELAAGRYWLGIETEAPPKAAELSRRFPLVGQAVKLGEEFWTVPLARELPQALGVAADGSLAKLFDDPRYADYFDRTTEAFAALGTLGDGNVVYSVEQQFRFAVFALGFNYRVNADVLTLMRAIRSNLVWGAAWAAAGTPDLESLAKKSPPEAGIAVSALG